MQLRRCCPSGRKRHRTLGIEARMVRVSPIGGNWLPLHDPVVILPTKTSDELHSERVDCPRICQSRQRSNSCAVVLERGHNPLLFGFSRRPHTRTLSATHSCQPGDLLRSCPAAWCKSGAGFTLSGGIGRFVSGGHSGQPDKRMFAQRSDCFQCHIAGALDGPFVVLFQQQGAD